MSGHKGHREHIAGKEKTVHAFDLRFVLFVFYVATPNLTRNDERPQRTQRTHKESRSIVHASIFPL